MRARVESDLRLTSTTDARIEDSIREAAWLRQQYGVPTGFQRAPFFEIQTDRFALIAVDTGVVKRVDEEQLAWLRSALDRARGKLTMAVLGHPLLCRRERSDAAATTSSPSSSGCCSSMTSRSSWPATRTTWSTTAKSRPPGAPMHHFVNGGGGAYLSFGTSLAWPAKPATPDWAFYPDTTAVTAKIEADTPWWKRPAWWWTRQFGAWPVTAEWLSAMFDYNVAPFFQSFVEVRVEPSANRILLQPLRHSRPAHVG